MIAKYYKRFIENLNKESEIDENRRRVIKGVAGLAALAAVGIEVSSIDPTLTHEDFYAMLRNGVIEGVTFYTDRPLILKDLQGIEIRNCKIVALDNFEGDSLIIMENAQYCVLSDLYLDCRGKTLHGMEFNSNVSIGDSVVKTARLG